MIVEHIIQLVLSSVEQEPGNWKKSGVVVLRDIKDFLPSTFSDSVIYVVRNGATQVCSQFFLPLNYIECFIDYSLPADRKGRIIGFNYQFWLKFRVIKAGLVLDPILPCLFMSTSSVSTNINKRWRSSNLVIIEFASEVPMIRFSLIWLLACCVSYSRFNKPPQEYAHKWSHFRQISQFTLRGIVLFLLGRVSPRQYKTHLPFGTPCILCFWFLEEYIATSMI